MKKHYIEPDMTVLRFDDQIRTDEILKIPGGMSGGGLVADGLILEEEEY